MSVSHDARTVTVPTQAGPADPPLAPAPSPSPARAVLPNAGVPGGDRPLNREEREFFLSIAAVFGVLAVFFMTFLLLAQYVWS